MLPTALTARHSASGPDHMPLQFYNTLTRRKESFVPEDPERVRMYVCGPTVYDYAHIGNARPVVVFDVLFRLLRHFYGHAHVTYVRNITDVDDKILAAADEQQRSISDITESTTAAFHEDMDALGALRPSVEPRATGHIDQMIGMIERLLAKGHAYVAEGHVLFSVPSMQDYGQLSRRSREDLVAGARVEVAPYKRDPADFVLWKPSTENQPGWESPWGRGRPGWHIECSAMSAQHLGESFDIHGGGQDLIFPHHENELAQSRCAHGNPLMARYWLHNGYVIVNGEKMSKSLGNFLTVRQLREEGHDGETIRLALLSGHYRQPLDINREKLAESKSQLDRLYGALRPLGNNLPEPSREETPERLVDALSDDLNTPLALSELHDLAHDLNKASATEKAKPAAALIAGARLMGLLQRPPESWFKGQGDDMDVAEIERLISQRIAARKARDFGTADRIRDDLAVRGILLEDGPDGTSWRRK